MKTRIWAVIVALSIIQPVSGEAKAESILEDRAIREYMKFVPHCKAMPHVPYRVTGLYSTQENANVKLFLDEKVAKWDPEKNPDILQTFKFYIRSSPAEMKARRNTECSQKYGDRPQRRDYNTCMQRAKERDKAITWLGKAHQWIKNGNEDPDIYFEVLEWMNRLPENIVRHDDWTRQHLKTTCPDWLKEATDTDIIKVFTSHKQRLFYRNAKDILQHLPDDHIYGDQTPYSIHVEYLPNLD